MRRSIAPKPIAPSTLSLLGLRVSGDLCGNTLYQTRTGKVVAFPQAPPLSPPSPLQLSIRATWRAAAAAWRSLTTEQRAAYERASKKLSLVATGYNVWTHFAVRPNDSSLQTLADQSGETLVPPPQCYPQAVSSE